MAGIYNSKEMMLYIDNVLVAREPITGKITNMPYPVNIGRLSDVDGQEYSGRTSNARFDRVAVFDRAISPDVLQSPSPDLIKQAVLWLELDEIKDNGDYFSMGIGGRTYGLIWPDRIAQPELWQVKKAAQPVKVSWIDAESGTVEIWNRHHYTNLSELDGRWQLLADDSVIQEGKLTIELPPLKRVNYELPIKNAYFTGRKRIPCFNQLSFE
ncbi:MAG: hypothetical protein HC906_13150 [Bacteroidales bacterium]|nr:hypothetical protein [Bacteroidales bacterium]